MRQIDAITVDSLIQSIYTTTYWYDDDKKITNMPYVIIPTYISRDKVIHKYYLRVNHTILYKGTTYNYKSDNDELDIVLNTQGIVVLPIYDDDHNYCGLYRIVIFDDGHKIGFVFNDGDNHET